MTTTPREREALGAENIPPIRAIGTLDGRCAPRLDRIEALKRSLDVSPVPLRLDEQMEVWAAEWGRDVRTIRSDVRAVLGERDVDGPLYLTRVSNGKRLIGTPRAFRERERRLYGQFNLGDFAPV